MPHRWYRRLFPASYWIAPEVPVLAASVLGAGVRFVLGLAALSLAGSALVHWRDRRLFGRVGGADRAEVKRIYRELEGWIDTRSPGQPYSLEGGRVSLVPRTRRFLPSVARLPSGGGAYSLFVLADFPRVIRVSSEDRLTGEVSGRKFATPEELRALLGEANRAVAPVSPC